MTDAQIQAELDALATEARLPAAANLDRLPTRRQVALLAQQDAVAVAAVAAAGDQIAVAVDAIAARLRTGGRLVYVGAGTSGWLALLDAAECGPTFGVADGRVVALVAGGAGATNDAIESAEDDADAARRDLNAHRISAADAVVGLSASGRTPYVLAAVAHARTIGALTVGVANNAGNALTRVVDLAIEVLTGAEVVSGSTRLKAGTAQKLVLNAISTLTMVQLGHTYADLMIDVQATNAKLRRRAERIVAAVTGADDDGVTAALDAAGGVAKVAVVSLLAGVDAGEAARRLHRTAGHARAAVEGCGRAAASRGAGVEGCGRAAASRGAGIEGCGAGQECDHAR
jgi:N-acetylmuramic acid 6-phosphate etherase